MGLVVRLGGRAGSLGWAMERVTELEDEFFECSPSDRFDVREEERVNEFRDQKSHGG